MRLSLDPKPFGAFIEYTIKPLLDDARELIELLDEKGLKLKSCLKIAVGLYLIDKLFSFATSIIVTGMICYTVLSLLNSHPTLR